MAEVATAVKIDEVTRLRVLKGRGSAFEARGSPTKRVNLRSSRTCWEKSGERNAAVGRGRWHDDRSAPTGSPGSRGPRSANHLTRDGPSAASPCQLRLESVERRLPVNATPSIGERGNLGVHTCGNLRVRLQRHHAAVITPGKPVENCVASKASTAGFGTNA